jgi:enediyne biosynthesis thioesterase
VVATLADSLALVTTRCSCEYFAELAAFDRIQVRMSLAELGQSRVLMRFDYFRLGEGEPELVAHGEQQIACLERSAGGLRAVPVPAELRIALAPYESATHERWHDQGHRSV